MKLVATSTGKKQAAYQASILPGSLLGIVAIPSSIGLTTYTVYDSNIGSTSSLILMQVKVPAGDHSVPFTLPFAIPANKGIYFTMTEDSGAGIASYIGYFAVG